MEKYNNLVEALIDSAKTNNGIRYIINPDEPEYILYKDFLAKAQQQLSYFQENGMKKGDEIILQFASVSKFVMAMWACFLGGLIPLTLEFCDNEDKIGKLFEIKKILNHPWLVTDSEHLLIRFQEYCDKNNMKEEFSDLEETILHLDDTLDCSGKCVLPEIRPEDTAYIQFSSGTTGAPKGVIVRHKNVINVFENFNSRYNFDHTDVSLNWTSLSHVFGIVAFHLVPILLGIDQILIPTNKFIVDPMLWFRMVNKYRASILGAPNFALKYATDQFDLAAARSEKWDLGCVRSILCAGEPISKTVVEIFNKKLGAWGIKDSAVVPFYGLSEVTLMVTTAELGTQACIIDRRCLSLGKKVVYTDLQDINAMEIVDCGAAIDNCQIRITDAAGKALSEDMIGNIELKSNCISGYYNNPKANKELINKEGWMNTYDMGFIHDERLMCVGRCKEMIIVNGVNYFPHDMEKAVLKGLGEEVTSQVIACGIENESKGTEDIFIFIKYTKPLADFGMIAKKVKALLYEYMGVRVEQVLPIEEVPKTVSGKIQRLPLKRKYLDGGFDETMKLMNLSVDKKKGENEHKVLGDSQESKNMLNYYISLVKDEVEDILGTKVNGDEIGFIDLGLNSLKLLELSQRIMKKVGFPISTTATFDYPTIRKLSKYLSKLVKEYDVVKESPSPYVKDQVPGNGDIAVVGMACRFPGASDTIYDFWDLLCNKMDPIINVPKDRWNHDIYSSGVTEKIKGGFLKNIEMFDYSFFRITPKEAANLDPQHRLMLELTWEAIEDAGWNPRDLSGTRTGVYTGIMNNTYLEVGEKAGHIGDPYHYIGSMLNGACGRVSYFYDLKGPSMAIDAACTSSIVAVQQAVLHLRTGICDKAITSGINLILNSHMHQSFTQLNALSENGKNASYGDDASGFVRSEGGAVLILKRLEDAINDHDNIWGIIKGIAVNHGGLTAGYTVPNGIAQREAIEQALKEGNIKPDKIDYIEGHGAATPIGDPQEINAISEVFGKRDRTLYLGSVKSNIGHLEAAAGMAGIIKVLLSMHYKKIPPNLHFNKGNKMISWDTNKIQIVDKLIKWEPDDGIMRAGVNSLGINGSNAHVILESFAGSKSDHYGEGIDTYPFVLSAATDISMKYQLKELLEWTKNSRYSVAEICNALAVSRTSLPRKLAFSIKADDQEGLTRKLSKLSDNEGAIGAENQEKPQTIVFLYTGQGSQYKNIAVQLYRQSDVFKDSLDQFDESFKSTLGISILAGINDETIDITNAQYAQPIIFSVQVSLTKYWESLGVRPDYMIGHSIGEFAAAYVDGIMSYEDAVLMVSERAAITDKCKAEGKMAGLFIDEAGARELIESYPDVSIAAVNSQENVTISGESSSIDAIRQEARRRRIFTEELKVSKPFHTRFMLKEKKELEEKLQRVNFNRPTNRFISTVLGRNIDSDEEMNKGYWGNHMICPVLFGQALKQSYAAGGRIFVEIGGMATLSGFAAKYFEKEDILSVPSLRPKRTDNEQLSDTICQLWCSGTAIKWENYFGSRGKRLERLPHTIYDRKYVWFSQTGNPIANSATGQEQSAPVPDTRWDEVSEQIKKYINRVAGFDVDMDDNLFEMGFDSLTVIQLRKLIKENYGLDISTNKVFSDLQTRRMLTKHIVDQLPELPAVKAKDVQPLAVKSDKVLSGNYSLGAEALFHKQLAIMEEQLNILKGIPVTQTDIEVQKPEKERIRKKNHTVGIMEEVSTPPLNRQQSDFINNLVKRRVSATGKSKEYAAKYRNVLSDWTVPINYDANIKEIVYPIVAEETKGAYFTDIDGNKYIDTCMGYGAIFYGNCPDFQTEAIRKQLDKGFGLGPQSQAVGEVAQLICDMTKAERVAFSNTGTEAVMAAVRLARTVTGKDKIVRFTNSFHGTFDGIMAEGAGEDVYPSSLGTTFSMVDDVVVLSYGTEEALKQIRSMGSDLAAVLVEPVQSRNPALQPREFLHDLRHICDKYDIALVFDEMVTGFRIRLGGAQEYFGVRADLVTYGKMAGGGMPIGIVAGKARYLDVIDGGRWKYGDDSEPIKELISFGGTFCKHPLSMVSCRAVLKRLRQTGEEEIIKLNKITEDFVNRANTYFCAENVPVYLAYFGSLYRFQSTVSTNMLILPLEMKLFYQLLLEAGIFVWERHICNFSVEHGKEEVDKILQAIKYSVETLRKGGFSFQKSCSDDPGKKKIDKEKFDLAPEERNVFLLSSMDGGNEAYQIISCFYIQGTLDFERLRESFEILAARHDMLRTGFQYAEGTIVHRIKDYVDQECIYLDRGDKDATDKLNDFLIRPMQLKTGTLWRWALVKEPHGHSSLYVNTHHIITDGKSVNTLIHDLVRAYNHQDLLPLTDSYRDYVLQQDYQTDIKYQTDREWWCGQFPSIPDELQLPYDVVGAKEPDFRGSVYYFKIEEGQYDQVRNFALKNRTSLFVVMLTAWTAFLGRIAGQDDFAVGIPVDGRGLGNFENTIGMFAKTLVIRFTPRQDFTFSEYMEGCKDSCYSAMDHCDYPLEDLLKDLNAIGNISTNPLFKILFNYDSYSENDITIDGKTMEPGMFKEQFSQYDMFLDIYERKGHLLCKLTYSTSRFRERKIANWMERFKRFLYQTTNDAGRQLGEYELLTSAERDDLSNWSAGKDVKLPAASIADTLESVIKSNPDRPAIWFRGTEINYKDLDLRAGQIAGRLKQAEIKPGDIVGILLPREPDLLLSLIAVLKIGAVWVPMDISYPDERIVHMVKNSGAKLVLTDKQIKAKYVHLKRIMLEIEDTDTAEPVPGFYQYSAADLAYIIYTSGSTGQPKGVQLEHASLLNFVVGLSKEMDWVKGSRTGCFTTPCFDIFMLETFLSWCKGGCTVLAGADETSDPSAMCKVIQNGRVDNLQLTPTRLLMLISGGKEAIETLGRVKTLIVGGEAFPESVLPMLKKYEALRIFNVYGPTETCIWSTCKELTGTDRITLGRPIANTTVYVLDRYMKYVAAGETGELWIGGMGVARGYMGNKELTQKVFKDNPHGEGVIYNTGDLVRWEDGELVFAGRNDGQVKIRGYRVELGEIEQVMLRRHDVKTAAAKIETIGNGNKVLVSYYQLHDGAVLSGDDMKQWLGRHLPGYMVSDFAVQVDEIPLTGNGKINKKELSLSLYQKEPEIAAKKSDDSEVRILGAWKRVLGDIPLSRTKNFFEQGGNSFSIVLLQEELELLFPGIFTVADLFSYPTISQQGQLISRSEEADSRSGTYALPVPERWFSSESRGGTVEAELDAEIRTELTALGLEYQLSLSEMVLAIYLIYLNKSLKTEDIPFWIVDDKKAVKPVCYHLSADQGIDSIFVKLKEVIDDIRTTDKQYCIKLVRDSKFKIHIGFSYQRLSGGELKERGLDLLLMVESASDKLNLLLEYTDKLDDSSMETIMNQLKNLIHHFVSVYIIHE